MMIELTLVETQDKREAAILLNVLLIRSVRVGYRGTSVSMAGDITDILVVESYDEVKQLITEVSCK